MQHFTDFPTINEHCAFKLFNVYIYFKCIKLCLLCTLGVSLFQRGAHYGLFFLGGSISPVLIPDTTDHRLGVRLPSLQAFYNLNQPLSSLLTAFIFLFVGVGFVLTGWCMAILKGSVLPGLLILSHDWKNFFHCKGMCCMCCNCVIWKVSIDWAQNLYSWQGFQTALDDATQESDEAHFHTNTSESWVLNYEKRFNLL